MSDDTPQINPPDSAVEDEPGEAVPLLTAVECRVLGALMEKQLSTPDNYPLTVNSLLGAMNQKTNREPVSNYQQGEIVRTLRELEEKRFVRYEMGARSERYEQRFTHENSLSKKQQALLSVMMLRGPQTINELQTRTQRLYDFTDRDDLEVSLERLTQGDLPMVVLIPRQSGQRDERYGHCLCGEIQIPSVSPAVSSGRSSKTTSEIEDLKSEVQLLRTQLVTLYELTGYRIGQDADDIPNHSDHTSTDQT